MQTQTYQTDTERYARCINVSKRIRWDIEQDVIQGRKFDFNKKFLPDGLSRVTELEFLDEHEQRLLSQIEGRTYANMFGLVERFINAKILEISKDHWLGDQVALEALIRFTDEELKHQELFRRLEILAGEQMPDGYTFLPQPNEVASLVLGKSTWAVLALTCHIELFTQVHYKSSIEPDGDVSDLYKDVFLFHWKEESQHAIMDELEWVRADQKLSDAQRDAAVQDLIELVVAVDGLLEAQSRSDAGYFMGICRRAFAGNEARQVEDLLHRAYRWQYIVSGVQQPRFQEVLSGLVSAQQMQRIQSALAPIIDS